MLVDTGKENQFKTVKALLDQLGIRRIDTVFNSHPHSDHLGGLPKLMEAYPIGRVITLFPEDFKDKKQRSVIQAKVMKAVRARGIPIVQMKTEDSFPWARPSAPSTSRRNGSCITTTCPAC